MNNDDEGGGWLAVLDPPGQAWWMRFISHPDDQSKGKSSFAVAGNSRLWISDAEARQLEGGCDADDY